MEYINQNFDGHNWSALVKARPLGDNIKMRGYNIGTDSKGYANRMAGVFDGRYLWIPGNAANRIMTRVDVRTGEYVDYPIDDVSGNPGSIHHSACDCCVFDGSNVWLNITPALKFNPINGNMTGYTVENGVNGNTNIDAAGVEFGVLIDSNLWYYHRTGNKAIRLDTNTGSITGFDLPAPAGNAYYACVTDGTDLWMIPYIRKDAWYIGHVKISNQEVIGFEEYPIDGTDVGNMNDVLNKNTYGFSRCAYYLDGFIWMASDSLDRLVKFDIETKQSTFYPFSEGVNGNHNMGSIASMPDDARGNNFMNITYDGKYLWMYPGNAGVDRLIRVDPDTGSMRGFEFAGEDLGDKPNFISYGLVFDGNSLWSIPVSSRSRLIRISSDKTVHSIEETYLTETGEVVKLPTLTWVEDGEDYIFVAPHIEGYICIGHTIDSGELITGTTASIDGVQADHDVVFIYTQADPSLTATITHQYHTTGGTPIKPDTTHSALIGQVYTATRRAISGYTYQGYQIDGGALQAGTTATIPDVQASHTITFVYKKDEDNGGSEPGGDGKCCCCRPYVHIHDNDFVFGDVHIEHLNLLESDCCNDSECK